MPEGRKVWLCLWVVCLVLGGSTAGKAADWVVTPSISARGQYLSNINYSPTNKKDDYIFTTTPNISLSYNSEITKLEGGLAVSGLAYLQNPGLDRINQYYYLNGNHQATPRLSLKLGTAFITDSTATEELIASGTTINRTIRTSLSATPGLKYSLTERLSTSVDYGFSLVDYQAKNYRNYTGQWLTQGFDYLLSEKLTLLTKVKGTYYEYNSNSYTYTLGPQIGFLYKYLEKLDMRFLGGLNLSWNTSNTRVLSARNQFGFINIPQKRQTSSNVSPFFTLGTDYKWETGSISLNYIRDESANAYGNQSQYNRFNLLANQSITRRLSFNLNPYFYLSTVDNPGSNYNSYYYGIGPGLSYKLTEKATVGAFYSFSYRTVVGTNNYAYPINNVWLTFNYSYPLHYQQ